MKTQFEPVDASDNVWEASVSARIDGESELRLDDLDSPYGRQVWDTYHLIGDIMRSPDLAIEPSERFHARLSTALDAEPRVLAPRAFLHRPGWRLGVSGMAVAAAVASVVWMVQPFLGDSASPITAPAVLAQADGNDTPDPSLNDYMAAHQDMAGVGAVRQVSFDGMGAR